MVTEEQRRQMRELQSQGMNFAEIGRRVGLARKTVSYQLQHARPRKPARKGYYEKPWTDKKDRCPRCGRLVFMPCFACAIEHGEVTDGITPNAPPRAVSPAADEAPGPASPGAAAPVP